MSGYCTYKRALVLLLILVVSFPIIAQVEWSFEAPSKVVQGQSFDILFTLQNAQGSNFKPPTFSNFSVVSGPSYVTNTSIVNGVSSSSFQIRYTLLASRMGRFSIGPATIVVSGQSLGTTSKAIDVVKSNESGSTGIEPYFVRMKLSSDTAYIGQQVIVDYFVYYRQQVQLNRFLRESDYDGLYAEEITQRGGGKSVEVINGNNYQVANVKSVAIYPQRLGVLDIDPAIMSIGIPDEGASRRMFFLRTMKSVNLTTDGQSVTVLPQPTPAPKSYSNAVGKYTMRSQYGKDDQNGNESYIVRIKIVGDGDRRLLEDPDIDLGPNFETYSPEVYSEDFKVVNGRVELSKTWSYIVVPKKTGNLKLIPHFSYLDGENGNFVTLAQDTFYIHVNEVEATTDFAIDHSESEINYIKYTKGRPITRVFRTPAYWSLLGASTLMLGFLFVKNKRQDRLDTLSSSENKKRKAKNAFDASLPKLTSFMNDKNGKEFYAELSITLSRYMLSKHGIDTSKKTEVIIARLSGLSSNKDSGLRASNFYEELMATCEMAVYASSSSNTEKMGADLQKAEKLVELLEV